MRSIRSTREQSCGYQYCPSSSYFQGSCRLHRPPASKSFRAKVFISRVMVFLTACQLFCTLCPQVTIGNGSQRELMTACFVLSHSIICSTHQEYLVSIHATALDHFIIILLSSSPWLQVCCEPVRAFSRSVLSFYSTGRTPSPVVFLFKADPSNLSTWISIRSTESSR